MKPRNMLSNRQAMPAAAFDAQAPRSSLRSGVSLAFALVLASALAGALACAGDAEPGLDLPLYELQEEWRIVSHDSSRLTRFSSVSDASPLLSGNRLMVIDAVEVLVRVYDEDGKLLHHFGNKGSGPGEFQRPAVGGYVGDTTWVGDAQGRRYHLYDSNFAPIGRATSPTRGGQSIGIVAGGRIAVRSGDTLLLYDYEDVALRKLEVRMRPAEYQFRYSWNGQEMTGVSPFAPASEVGGLPGGRRLLFIEPAELFGGEPGQLSLRWMNMPDGTLSERTIATLPLQRIPDAVFDSVIAASMKTRGITEPAGVAEYTSRAKRSEFAPPFSGVSLLSESGIWLRQALDRTTHIVLSPEGKPLMRVRVPARTSLLGASGEFVWALGRDDDNVPVVFKYRLKRAAGDG